MPDHDRDPGLSDTAPTCRRVAVVTNARAGALVDRPDHGPSLQEMFAAAGIEARFVPGEGGTLPERMAAALAMVRAEGLDTLVVAGGDGTVACATQALAGGDVPLGILPFGTMNLLAKDLGLPVDDTEAAVRVVAEGRARRIDVGEVNGQVFLCASMLGLPARLGRHREEARGSTLELWLRMASATVRGVRHVVPFRAVVAVGSERALVRATAVTVTVNPVEEASGAGFRRPCLDGGALSLYVVDEAGAAGLVGFVLRVAMGRWRRARALQEWSAPALTLHRRGRATRVMNDGELMLLAPPLAYTCRPGALTVIVAQEGAA